MVDTVLLSICLALPGRGNQKGRASRYFWALVHAALSVVENSLASRVCTPWLRAKKKSTLVRKSSTSASANGTNVFGNSAKRAARPSLLSATLSSSKNVRTAMPRPISGSRKKGSLPWLAAQSDNLLQKADSLVADFQQVISLALRLPIHEHRCHSCFDQVAICDSNRRRQ